MINNLIMKVIYILTMWMRERKFRHKGGVSLHSRAPEKSKVYLRNIYLSELFSVF